MSTFQVPQFIEQEAKIIGFLTLKQFLYVAAGAGLIFIAFYIFSFFFWFMISVVIAGITVSLAFVKINGQDMTKVLVAALNYVWRPRTYTWQRATTETTFETSEFEKIQAVRQSMTLQEKLKSAALSVTTGKFFSAKTPRKTGPRYQAVTYATGEKKMAKRVDY